MVQRLSMTRNLSMCRNLECDPLLRAIHPTNAILTIGHEACSVYCHSPSLSNSATTFLKESALLSKYAIMSVCRAETANFEPRIVLWQQQASSFYMPRTFPYAYRGSMKALLLVNRRYQHAATQAAS